MAAPSSDQEGNGIPHGLFVALGAVLLLVALVSFLESPGAIVSLQPEAPGAAIWLLVVVEIVWLLTVYDLLSEPRLAIPHRALWLAVLVLLNFLGSIFYLLLKNRYLSSKIELP